MTGDRTLQETVVNGSKIAASQVKIPETEFSFDLDKVLQNIQSRGGVATTNDYRITITAPTLDSSRKNSLGQEDSSYKQRLQDVGVLVSEDSKAIYQIVKKGIYLPKELFTRVTIPELGMLFKNSPESGYQLTAYPSDIVPIELEYWDYADLALTKVFEYLYSIQFDSKGMLIPSYNMYQVDIASGEKSSTFHSVSFGKPKMSDSSASFNLRQFVVKVYFEDYVDGYNTSSQYNELL